MSKLIGGILLIIGTSIGAGILAMPVTVSEAGFLSSTILLFVCWVLMTFSALVILEVNLWMPDNSNIISMARATLGFWGQAVAWLTYLALLYSLLAVYMSAGTDMLHALLAMINIPMSNWLATTLFTLVLAIVVYLGTRTIDYVNRLLMFVKLGSFFLLLFFVLGHIKLANLEAAAPHKVLASVMVMITSYGFASIIPSLRVYFNSDVKQLRKVVLIGSIVPLICYILWVLAILGTLPRTGEYGLVAILQSGHVTSMLMLALQKISSSEAISQLSKIFTSICVATAFLGVSLSLSDFLADGFGLRKEGLGKLKVYGLTFLPPFLIVLFYPAAFLMALNYSGTFTSILLALLPILMVWRGRYYLKMSGPYQVAGGKTTIIIAMILSLVAVAIGITEEFHLL